MKKFVAFAFVDVAAAFASCAGNNEQNAQDSTAKDSATMVESVVSTVDSAAGVAGAAIDSAASAAKAAVDSMAK